MELRRKECEYVIPQDEEGRAMRVSTRVKKLEDAVPKCDGRLRLAPEGHVPSEADRCRRCGGCHILVIEEVIVTAADLEAEREGRPCE
jgi:hypothetical protein